MQLGVFGYTLDIIWHFLKFECVGVPGYVRTCSGYIWVPITGAVPEVNFSFHLLIKK